MITGKGEQPKSWYTTNKMMKLKQTRAVVFKMSFLLTMGAETTHANWSKNSHLTLWKASKVRTFLLGCVFFFGGGVGYAFGFAHVLQVKEYIPKAQIRYDIRNTCC